MQREIFVQGELTGQGQTAYSRGRSNFMPNEGGEAPKSPGARPDARQAAREYVASLGGRQPTFEESQALRLMNELGIPSIAGGSDTEPPEPGGPEVPGKPRAGSRRRLEQQPIPTVRANEDTRFKFNAQGEFIGFELSSPTPDAIQRAREYALTNFLTGLNLEQQESRDRLRAASQKGPKAYAQALVNETLILSAKQAQPFIELEYTSLTEAVRSEAGGTLPQDANEEIERRLDALDRKKLPAQKAAGLRSIITTLKRYQKGTPPTTRPAGAGDGGRRPTTAGGAGAEEPRDGAPLEGPAPGPEPEEREREEGGPRNTVEGIINSLNPDDFPVEYKGIVGTIKDLVTAGRTDPDTIKEMLSKATEARIAGGDSAKYQEIVRNFSQALTQSQADQKEAQKSQQIPEVETDHALLEPFVNQYNNLIKRISGVETPEQRDLRFAKNKEVRDIEFFAFDAAGNRIHSDAEVAAFELARDTFLADVSEQLAKVSHDPRMREAPQHLDRLMEAILGDNEEHAYDVIEEIIGDGDISDGSYHRLVEFAIDNIPASAHKDHMVQFLLEYAVERIILGGDQNPQEQYPQLNLYQTDNLDRLTQTARKFDERRFKEYKRLGNKVDFYPPLHTLQYLTNLRSKRMIMHELFRSMKDEQTYTSFITQYLRKNGLAFVEDDIVGVADSQGLYDQALASTHSLNKNGWLTHRDMAVIDNVVLKNMLAQSRHVDSFGKSFTKVAVNDDGTLRRVNAIRGMREWETNRAHLMGRSLSAASQRRMTYVAIGDVPENLDLLNMSVESEFLVRGIGLFKFISERWHSHGPAKRVREIFKREQTRVVKPNEKWKLKVDDYDPRKYGVKNREGKYIGLYGKSQDAFALVDVGVTDPKSNSWRGNLMFLKQRRFQTEQIGGERLTIGDAIDIIRADVKNQVTGGHGGHMTREQKKEYGRQFNARVRPLIERQRLFSGHLLKVTDLDEENKTIIWKRSADLIPSRTAAFFPSELENILNQNGRGGMSAWIGEGVDRKGNPILGLRDKLWTAERMRVRNDAKMLQTTDTTSYAGSRRNDLKLEHFLDVVGLTPQEKVIVAKLQEVGKYYADQLAHMTFPFTALMEDAPRTGYDELQDEDYDRIIVRDRKDFNEGFGPVIGIFDDPVKKPDEIVNALFETVHKIKNPLGLGDAQARVEPMIVAIMDMRMEKEIAGWTGYIMKAFRKGRSQIEDFNLQANISDNAEERKGMLSAMAQKDIISDDPNEVDDLRRTQYIRMKDKEKARRRDEVAGFFRMILLLFGPVFVKEMFGDAANPKEMGIA